MAFFLLVKFQLYLYKCKKWKVDQVNKVKCYNITFIIKTFFIIMSNSQCNPNAVVPSHILIPIHCCLLLLGSIFKENTYSQQKFTVTKYSCNITIGKMWCVIVAVSHGLKPSKKTLMRKSASLSGAFQREKPCLTDRILCGWSFSQENLSTPTSLMVPCNTPCLRWVVSLRFGLFES